MLHANASLRVLLFFCACRSLRTSPQRCVAICGSIPDHGRGCCHRLGTLGTSRSRGLLCNISKLKWTQACILHIMDHRCNMCCHRFRYRFLKCIESFSMWNLSCFMVHSFCYFTSSAPCWPVSKSDRTASAIVFHDLLVPCLVRPDCNRRLF